MATPQVLQVDCTFHNDSKQIINLSPRLQVSDDSIDAMEFQQYLYKQCNICPTEQYITIEQHHSCSFNCFIQIFCRIFYYIFPYICCCCCWFYPLLETPKPFKSQRIKVTQNKIIKIKFKEYKQSTNRYCGNYKPKNSEIAFPIGCRINIVIWACVFVLLLPVAVSSAITLVAVKDNDGYVGLTTTPMPSSEYDINVLEFMTTPYLIIIAAMIGIYVSSGRLWLILNPNKSEIYIKYGSCMDHCFFCQKYRKDRFDINKFKGFRFQLKYNILENDDGSYVKFIVEDEKNVNNKHLERSFCGKHYYDINYLKFVQTFRQKYPQRNDVHFSVSKQLKLRLKGLGFDDEILNESWSVVDLNVSNISNGENIENTTSLATEHTDNIVLDTLKTSLLPK